MIFSSPIDPQLTQCSLNCSRDSAGPGRIGRSMRKLPMQPAVRDTQDMQNQTRQTQTHGKRRNDAAYGTGEDDHKITKIVLRGGVGGEHLVAPSRYSRYNRHTRRTWSPPNRYSRYTTLYIRHPRSTWS